MQWPLGGFLSFHCLAPRVSAHNPHRVHPSSKAQAVFLIFELIIYFSKPKDLSSSLIRGELFSFGWQALNGIGGDMGRTQKATLSLGCSGQRMWKVVMSCSVSLDCIFSPRCLNHSRLHNAKWNEGYGKS